MGQLSCLSKMYYIIDGSGNFYRLSSSGQLIAASGKEEAETFTFVDANRKIGGGKKAKFYHTIEVEEIEKMEQTIIDSSEEKVMLAVDTIVSTISENTTNESGEECVEEGVMEQIEEEPDTFDISQVNWMEFLEYFCSIMDALGEYKTDLESRQLGFDLKMQDLMHYVELCEMDDNRRLEIMDMITETRQCRRDVKDEIQRIEYFQQSLGTSSNASKCKNSIRQMEKLMSRTYHPRKIPDLFEGAEFHMSRELPYWNKKQIEQTAEEFDGTNNEGGYGYMDYYSGIESRENAERMGTVFDGKTNNWLNFARQQKEFYDNVCQHMDNLEIDIRTIDIRIEEILVRIEDANFNVTQGYKVFKELKDLRNEKKNKSRELEALRSLTYGIDCRYMSENLAYSIQEMEQICNATKQGVSDMELDIKDEEIEQPDSLLEVLAG